MITLNNISHSYGEHLIIDNYSLSVAPNEVITIIGPSGCGKSTLLKLISKEIKLQAGTISMTNSKLGYAPQKNLLLPWMNIYENVTLYYNLNKENINENLVNDLFKTFELDNVKQLYPHQISGGMQSRANLMRTVLMTGDLMLLDEPFTGVDMITKIKLCDWFSTMIKTLEKSVIYITHDIDEAIKISDKIMIVSAKPMKHIITLEKCDFDKELILKYLT